MRNIRHCFLVALALLTLNACGGGGGAGSAAPKTTAVVTIKLTGTLPTSTAISGTAFTLTLPANVAPALSSGAVASGVVTLSGTFFGGSQTQPVYTAATGSTLGTLYLILTNALKAGTTQVGEVATITLQLANGATPTVNDFVVSGVSVTDVPYNAIAGMNATVASVTLQ